MPSPGRPRDVHADKAILAATQALLATRGYSGVTMERVATAAGVGKQTVYRRWSSKAPLVADAILDAYGRGGSFPVPDTGDIGADLRAWLVEHGEFLAEPGAASMIRALTAAAVSDPDDRSFYALLAQPQQEGLLERLQKALATGEIRSDTDIVALADALIGILLYSMLTRAPFAEMTDRFNGLVDALVSGVRP